MNLRKFALLVMVCSMMYGFGVDTTSASASTGKRVSEQVAVETALPEAVPSSEPNILSEPTKAPEQAVTAPKATSTPKKEHPKKTKKSKKKAKKPYTKSELRLMSSIIYCEAGSECFQGKLAVGIVVMNRKKSRSFPNTIKGVIYERNQFTPARNGRLSRRLKEYDKGKTKSAQWKSCIAAAKKTLSGHSTIIRKGRVRTMKGIYFFSGGLRNPKFRLGGHMFK